MAGGMPSAMVGLMSVSRSVQRAGAMAGISPSVAVPMPAGPGMTVPGARTGVMAEAIQPHCGQTGAAQQQTESIEIHRIDPATAHWATYRLTSNLCRAFFCWPIASGTSFVALVSLEFEYSKNTRFQPGRYGRCPRETMPCGEGLRTPWWTMASSAWLDLERLRLEGGKALAVGPAVTRSIACCVIEMRSPCAEGQELEKGKGRARSRPWRFPRIRRPGC